MLIIGWPRGYLAVANGLVLFGGFIALLAITSPAETLPFRAALVFVGGSALGNACSWFSKTLDATTRGLRKVTALPLADARIAAWLDYAGLTLQLFAALGAAGLLVVEVVTT